MRYVPDKTGHFPRRVWFDEGEIDLLLERELSALNLLPTASAPEVDVEEFIEERFGLAPEHAELPVGVLGATRFEGAKPTAIVVVKELLDGANSNKLTERRLRSTLAHEGAGHALLHTPLFEEDLQRSLFGTPRPVVEQMCRETNTNINGYNGEWWEYQANQAIGALLMPKTLFSQLVDELLLPRERDALNERFLRKRIEQQLSDAFNVSREAVRYRIEQLKLAPMKAQERLSF